MVRGGIDIGCWDRDPSVLRLFQGKDGGMIYLEIPLCY